MSNTELAIPAISNAAPITAQASSTDNPPIADTARSVAVPTALRDDARMQMETACVDLVCQFESMLSRSVQERLDGYIGEIVPIVDESMQIALAFGETHFIGETLEILNRRVHDVSECSQSLRQAVSSFEWKTFRWIIGRESANELDILKIHGELETAIAAAIVAAIGPAIEVLGPQSTSGAELLKIVRQFIAELDEKW